MTRITEDTSLEEIAAMVSQALDRAGIPAVLGGGGAVTMYSENRYMTTDLDFITTERNRDIAPVVAELGFKPRGKNFVHDDSRFFLEFPPGPLSFGDRYVDSSQTAVIDTRFGRIRVVTPTQCLMDRVAWVFHGKDPQSRAQAVLVARHQCIDWADVYMWAEDEGIPRDLIDRIRADARALIHL